MADNRPLAGNHEEGCKRAFLKFDPDCKACLRIKAGTHKRIHNGRAAYAMMMTRRERTKRWA